MRKPIHIYTQLHLWCKEQWLDRNVSAALRNDTPRIREESLHIRQRPCATSPQHGNVQHAEQIHGALLYPSKIWKQFLGWFSHVPTIPTIQHMYWYSACMVRSTVRKVSLCFTLAFRQAPRPGIKHLRDWDGKKANHRIEMIYNDITIWNGMKCWVTNYWIFMNIYINKAKFHK